MKEWQEILDELVSRYPVLQKNRPEIEAAALEIVACYRKDGMVFTCGNGGSAADADHIVGELVKGFTKKRPMPMMDAELFRQHEDTAFLADRLQCGFRAMSLMSQTGIYTAAQNDLDPDAGPAQQLYAMGRRGDVLLGISTSGNARDLYFACRAAKVRGMKIIGLSGKTGGLLAKEADVNICVASQETYQIQELHLPIYHGICRMVECAFFEK